jgi:hypothetical protein
VKVLSIIEPWGTLIAENQKLIETRSWATKYRGELYFHTSSKKVKISDPKIKNLLTLIPSIELKYGYIIFKCELVDCIYMDEKFIEEIKKNPTEYICGEYSVGRYAWVLKNVQKLEEPIPAKGHLNIWNFEI